MKFNFELDNRKKFNYKDYRALIDALLIDSKTTGENHSDAYLDYTKMNVTRMRRLDKTAVLESELLDSLKNVKPQTWCVLTEAWCGDAAQNLPWIVKMAEASQNIELILLLRDENVDVMDSYLTDNGRSIPKLIAIDKDKNEIFTWGPRPQEIQAIYKELKMEGKEYTDISETVHAWYAKDKGKNLQSEFMALLNLNK